jgi:hypothetical protein
MVISIPETLDKSFPRTPYTLSPTGAMVTLGAAIASGDSQHKKNNTIHQGKNGSFMFTKPLQIV